MAKLFSPYCLPVFILHLCAWGSPFTTRQDHSIRWLEQVGPNDAEFSFCCPSLKQMGWGGHFIPKFTGPLASSGVANPSPTSHSGFWVLAHSPFLLSSLQTDSFTHSLSLALSSALLFPIWPPGRCVALKQALLIEHLFRHGAGSVACGRAAGGSSRGDIMSYYISWYVSFTCMHAHFTGTRSRRHSETQTHAAASPHQHYCSFHLTWKCKKPWLVLHKDV